MPETTRRRVLARTRARLCSLLSRGAARGELAAPIEAAVLRGELQQLQVHQVVGDDLEGLPVVLPPPAADEAEVGVEAAREGGGRLQEEGVVLRRLQETPRVAVGAVHDEADVVVVVHLRVRREQVRPVARAVAEERLARRLIEVPERAGEVAGGPPEDRTHVERARLRVPSVRHAEVAAGAVLPRGHFPLSERRRRRVERAVLRGGAREDPGQLPLQFRLLRRQERRRHHDCTDHPASSSLLRRSGFTSPARAPSARRRRRARR